MFYVSQCLKCKHRLEDAGLRCLAFPDGIPSAFYNGDVSHDSVKVGQEGDYTYLAKEKFLEHDRRLRRLKERRGELEQELIEALLELANSELIDLPTWSKIIFDFEVLQINAYKFHDLSAYDDEKRVIFDKQCSDKLLSTTVQLILSESLIKKCKRVKIYLSKDKSYSVDFQ